MITLNKILEDKNVKIIKKEHDSNLLPDLKIALDILKKHIKINNNIGILGDFDTDGITATSSFIIGFQDLFPKHNFFYKVPERSEGHGLSKKNIDYMNSKNVKLIFSCDNGSNDIEMIDYAKELGIDIIITDHHQITLKKEEITFPLINCEREDSTYPFSHLCGCGIVYKFLQAVENSDLTENKIQEHNRKILQQLICIGTIVDMVHLDDENLYFVNTFKHHFTSENSEFFRLLTELTDYHPDNGGWFGWIVGPIFNGAGRLERANGLIETIIKQHNIQNLDEILQYYIGLNDYRKELTKEWNTFLKDKIKKTKHVNLITHDKIPSGLKRLIANEYLEGKVAFCGSPNSENKNIIDCSVSNAYGINLLDFLREQDFTDNVGGHYGAFGFSYHKDKEDKFLEELNKFIDSQEISKKDSNYDYELGHQNLTLDFVKEISSFIWGVGLEEPIFKIKAKVKTGMILAKNHLKLVLVLEDGREIEAIQWKNTNLKDYIGKELDFYITLNINRYRGEEKIQFFFL